jgi:hypothetical protein
MQTTQEDTEIFFVLSKFRPLVPVSNLTDPTTSFQVSQRFIFLEVCIVLLVLQFVIRQPLNVSSPLLAAE